MNSLESDDFIPKRKHIGDDPFSALDEDLPNKSAKVALEQYSDISDDEDFEIPCSQRRLPSR